MEPYIYSIGIMRTDCNSMRGSVGHGVDLVVCMLDFGADGDNLASSTCLNTIQNGNGVPYQFG